MYAHVYYNIGKNIRAFITFFDSNLYAASNQTRLFVLLQMGTDLQVQQFSFLVESPELINDDSMSAPSLAGGRRFHRVFSKKDFPLLGQVRFLFW